MLLLLSATGGDHEQKPESRQQAHVRDQADGGASERARSAEDAVTHRSRFGRFSRWRRRSCMDEDDPFDAVGAGNQEFYPL
eukprot:386736-Hanusia_phi.AAC.1